MLPRSSVRSGLFVLLLCFVAFPGFAQNWETLPAGAQALHALEARFGRARGDSALALRLLDTLRTTAHQLDSPFARAFVARKEAQYAQARGRLAEARAHMHRAKRGYLGEDLPAYAAKTYLDLARLETPRENFARAFAYADSAYHYGRAGGDPRMIQGALNAMAITKRRGGDPAAAIPYLQEAFGLSVGNDRFSPLLNLSNAYADLDQLDSCIHYGQQALAVARAEEPPNPIKLGIVSSNLAERYRTQGQSERALAAAEDAMAAFEQRGTAHHRLAARTVAASAAQSLGDLPRALRYLQESYALLGPEAALDTRRSVHRGLAEVYGGLGEPDSVTVHLNAFADLTEAIVDKDRTAALAEMETRFETKRKEFAIERLKQEEALTRATLRRRTYGLGLAALLLALFAFLGYRLWQQRRRISDQNTVIRQALADKELLLKEIHHRVKNNLQLVSSLLSLQSGHVSDPVAADALQLSKSRVRSMALIHQRLYTGNEVSTRIDAADYLDKLAREVLSTHLPPDAHVALHTELLPVELDIERLIPLGLFANEAITNAAKYAYRDGEEGQLTVALQRTADDRLRFSVTDDGPGRAATTDHEESGFGSLLMAALTEQLHGTLEVTASAAGTRVALDF